MPEGVITWLKGWPVPFADEAAAIDYFGGGRLGQGWADGLAATSAGLMPRFDVDVMHKAILAVHSEDRWNEWSSIRQPVLLVKAGDGFLSQAEANRMLATNPNARLVTIDGTGHDVHLEAPDKLAAALLVFLDDHSVGNPALVVPRHAGHGLKSPPRRRAHVAAASDQTPRRSRTR